MLKVPTIPPTKTALTGASVGMLLGTGNSGGPLAPQGIRTFLGTGLAPTISQVIAAANFYTLNDTSPTYTSTTSRWDPYNNVIKYANQRRQRPFVINGVTFQSDLIESARTNLLASGTSEHFERWTVGSGTPVVTTDTLACPNAEVVADTLTEGSGTGTQGVSQLITKAASSLAYVGSCYIKNKTGSREVSVNLDDGTLTNGVQVRINPATGALTSAPAAFGAGWAVNTAAGTGGYTITDAGGGWYRVSVIATSDTTTTVRFRVGLYNNSDSYAGDGTSAVYLWGADANQATFAAATCLCRNLLLQSETLGTSWTATRSTITSNTTADPITGNLTADTINDDNTATNTHFITQSFTKAASSLQFTYTTYIKQSGRTWCLVMCADTAVLGGTNGAGTYFDVANGVKGTTVTVGAGWTLNASSITAVGSWYRVSITVTTAATTTIACQVGGATGDNGKTYSGAGAAALICWGNQLEYGSQVNQYWATTTAGLRTADVLTSTLTGITDARTNLLLWAEQFDNATWTKTDTTITANAATDPNGNAYADLATTGVAGTGAIAGNSATITGGATVTGSIFAKYVDTPWVIVRVSAGADRFQAWFNIQTGAVGSSSVAGAGTFTSAGIAPYGNGWYRCSITGVVNPASTTVAMRNIAVSADADGTPTSNSNRYLFGAQLVQSATLSDYIPTGSSAITTGPTGLSRTTGTLVSIVMPRNWTGDQDGATTYRVVEFDDTNNTFLRRQNATDIGYRRPDAGGAQGGNFTSSLASNALSQLAMTWSASAITGYRAGVSGGSDATLQAPFNATSTALIGHSGSGANAFFGYVLCLYSHQQVIPGSTLALIYAATTAP